MVAPNLQSISDGLYVWSPQPSAGWGLANCGLLTSPTSAAWIDTPYDTVLAGEFYDRGRELLAPGTDVDWLFVTHGNGDHLWGAAAAPRAKVVYTKETAEHIEHEPDPAQLHALVHGSDPDSVVGWYLKRHFGRYQWVTSTLPEPTIAFTGELEVSVGGVPVQLTQLAPAHTVGDMIAYLPRQRTCFSGDVIFAAAPDHPGDHPCHWAGPLAGVIEGCERVLATGAQIIVPGHGPVLDRAGVDAHLGYLHHLRERSHQLHAAGATVGEAARRIIAEHRDPELELPERVLITIGSEFSHLDGSTPPSMLERVSAMAQLAWELEQPTAQGAQSIPSIPTSRTSGDSSSVPV